MPVLPMSAWRVCPSKAHLQRPSAQHFHLPVHGCKVQHLVQHAPLRASSSPVQLLSSLDDPFCEDDLSGLWSSAHCQAQWEDAEGASVSSMDDNLDSPLHSAEVAAQMLLQHDFSPSLPLTSIRIAPTRYDGLSSLDEEVIFTAATLLSKSMEQAEAAMYKAAGSELAHLIDTAEMTVQSEDEVDDTPLLLSAALLDAKLDDSSSSASNAPSHLHSSAFAPGSSTASHNTAHIAASSTSRQALAAAAHAAALDDACELSDEPSACMQASMWEDPCSAWEPTGACLEASASPVSQQGSTQQVQAQAMTEGPKKSVKRAAWISGAEATFEGWLEGGLQSVGMSWGADEWCATAAA